MPAEQARDVARAYKGLADHLMQMGVRYEAARAERQSAWWLAYSLTLQHTASPEQGSGG